MTPGAEGRSGRVECADARTPSPIGDVLGAAARMGGNQEGKKEKSPAAESGIPAPKLASSAPEGLFFSTSVSRLTVVQRETGNGVGIVTEGR